MKAINENKTFRKRSPGWNVLKTLFSPPRVDRRKRNSLKTLRTHYQFQSTSRNIRNLVKMADGRFPFLSFILGLISNLIASFSSWWADDTRGRQNIIRLFSLPLSRGGSLDLPLAGAHQMEPPSPLISWVNPFPSRFINRTACFPARNVSYFLESRMSPSKNKVGWSRTREPVLRPFSFYTIRPFLWFYSR